MVAASVVIWCLVSSDWRALLARRARWHFWLLASLLCGLFWGVIGLSLEAALRLHPLLMTSFCLIFGFRLSVLGGGLALLLTTWLVFLQLSGLPAQQLEWAANPLWQNFSYNLLLGVIFPAAITYGILKVITRWQVQNLFLYTLGAGFAGGMLTMLVTGGVGVLLAYLLNESHGLLLTHNSHLFLLLAFPEGFCNGAIISTLAVLAPEMVKTYDHEFYLQQS